MKLVWTKGIKDKVHIYHWDHVHQWRTTVHGVEYVVQINDLVMSGWRVSLYYVPPGRILTEFLIEALQPTYNRAQHHARILRENLLTIIMEATL